MAAERMTACGPGDVEGIEFASDGGRVERDRERDAATVTGCGRPFGIAGSTTVPRAESRCSIAGVGRMSGMPDLTYPPPRPPIRSTTITARPSRIRTGRSRTATRRCPVPDRRRERPDRALLPSGIPARAVIRSRLAELWDYPRAGAPWRRGDRWFQMRNTGLQDQDVLWTADGPEADGRILLDPNTLNEGGTTALSIVDVSDSGKLVACATSEAGSDWHTWTVRRVATGELLPDRVEWSKFTSAAWTADDAGFFYGRFPEPPADAAFDAPNRDMELRYHRLGTAQSEDPARVLDPAGARVGLRAPGHRRRAAPRRDRVAWHGPGDPDLRRGPRPAVSKSTPGCGRSSMLPMPRTNPSLPWTGRSTCKPTAMPHSVGSSPSMSLFPVGARDHPGRPGRPRAGRPRRGSPRRRLPPRSACTGGDPRTRRSTGRRRRPAGDRLDHRGRKQADRTDDELFLTFATFATPSTGPRRADGRWRRPRSPPAGAGLGSRRLRHPSRCSSRWETLSPSRCSSRAVATWNPPERSRHSSTVTAGS